MSTAVAVRARPILFSGPMVRAIMDRERPKTVTRRVIAPQPVLAIMDHRGAEALAACRSSGVIPDGDTPRWQWRGTFCMPWPAAIRTRSPYGQPGDQLWVRETWRFIGTDMNRLGRTHSVQDGVVEYADGSRRSIETDWQNVERWMSRPLRTRPSIHMPRWASRLTLEVLSVRVERLQEITDADCEAEGLTKRGHWWGVGPDWQGDGIDTCPRATFATLWDQLNATRGYSWASNPWVWIVEFRRIDA